MKKTIRLLSVLIVFLSSTLACSLSGTQTEPAALDVAPTATEVAATKSPAVTEAATEPAQPKIETEFPVLQDAFDTMDLGNSSISYKTKVKQTDIITFYRDEFKKAGYTEREIATVITDTLFSMVFDGHASGKAIVIQAVDLGGSTNVTLRFE